MNISNYYWYFSGVLTPRFCDDVIAYANIDTGSNTSYSDVSTGSNTSYSDVATGSNTSYNDVTGEAA